MNEEINEEWTREAPIPPKPGEPFDYWWFWDDREAHPTVLELWGDKSISFKKGWWARVMVKRPLTNPRTENKRKTPPPPPTPPIHIIKEGSSKSNPPKPPKKVDPPVESGGLLSYTPK